MENYQHHPRLLCNQHGSNILKCILTTLDVTLLDYILDHAGIREVNAYNVDNGAASLQYMIFIIYK